MIALCLAMFIFAILTRNHTPKPARLFGEFKDHENDTFIYTGEMKEGKPHGKGMAIYRDGRTYEGGFQNGLKHDTNACFTDRKHSVFKGEYTNDTIRKGRLNYYDGNIYFIGDFADNQPWSGVWYFVKNNKPFIRLTNGKEEVLR